MDGSNSENAAAAIVDPSVLARMPLAEATLTVWRFVFDDDRLQGLWERFRGRCYDKIIRFPTMTHLVAEALLQYGGSGRRAFEKNIEHNHLAASVAAAKILAMASSWSAPARKTMPCWGQGSQRA